MQQQKQAKSVRPAVRTKNEQATAIIHEVARSPGHDAALLWAGIQDRVASFGVSASCRLMMGQWELEGWNAEGDMIGCALARVAVSRPSGFHSGLKCVVIGWSAEFLHIVLTYAQHPVMLVIRGRESWCCPSRGWRLPAMPVNRRL